MILIVFNLSILFINFNVFICYLFKNFRRPITFCFLNIFGFLLWNWLLLFLILILIILEFCLIRMCIWCLVSIYIFINIILFSLLWKFFKGIRIHILKNICSIEFFIFFLLRFINIHLLNVFDFRLFFWNYILQFLKLNLFLFI